MRLNNMNSIRNIYECSWLFRNKRMDIDKPINMTRDRFGTVTFIQGLEYMIEDPVQDIRSITNV